ncbi:hypothetical protein RDWZM_004222 [Blomia tropicalis]|uniref:Uncharacterized protein n=1 Tax=Blomia tropicalis TaxID=40697 RepID=A0A9Q0MJL8_BLOTA|nr:hypothetical protein RDWZM_004222 [Blomia tropicalis]
MNYMPKTMKILADEGVHIKNAYVTTPMCCPSRSSILTGLYVHNHNVYTNGENCSSPQWQQTHERRTFATYLRDSGYRTAFFGKYLNEYDGNHIPPGWSDWSALIRNSRYYNYTLNVNGDKVRHGSDYELDYYPDLILNDSLQYMRYSKRFFSNKPYLLVMSFPSPHGPEDSAPQFQHLFQNEKGHRTPTWNYAPNEDKQWLLRNTNKMSPIHQKFTDFLNMKRLQTLQSVDNAVHNIYTELKNLNELDNTYIIYTSDHGYHLGQFGLVKGKAMPLSLMFEFHSLLSQIVLNIDIAPTLLDIAGIRIPSQMDGISFLPHLKLLNSGNEKLSSNNINQRDSFIIEKGKFNQTKSIDRLLIPIIGKKQWINMECQKPEYQNPCMPLQKFECFIDEMGNYRIRRCHRHKGHGNLRKKVYKKCICNNGNNLSTQQEVVSPQFGINRHPGKRFRNNNLRNNNHRIRRNEHVYEAMHDMLNDEFPTRTIFDVNGVYELKKIIDFYSRTQETTNHNDGNGNRTERENLNDITNITTNNVLSFLGKDNENYMNNTFCMMAQNGMNIECKEEIYRDQQSWIANKQYINTAIRQLQKRLLELKDFRRYINKNKFKNTYGSRMNNDQECQCDITQQPVSHMSQRQLINHKWNLRNVGRKRWIKRHEKKLRRRGKFENTTCELAVNKQMNCFKHDNEHWKTPPLWTDGPFCFCQNSLNNSFWCLRTINSTHNSLYCEFVTGFLIYFDLNKDPFQQRNAIYDLEFSTLEELNRKLTHLKNCSGSNECSSVRDRTKNGLNQININYHIPKLPNFSRAIYVYE